MWHLPTPDLVLVIPMLPPGHGESPRSQGHRLQSAGVAHGGLEDGAMPQEWSCWLVALGNWCQCGG